MMIYYQEIKQFILKPFIEKRSLMDRKLISKKRIEIYFDHRKKQKVMGFVFVVLVGMDQIHDDKMVVAVEIDDDKHDY